MRTDGTFAGTRQVVDLAAGAASPAIERLTAFGNSVLFWANDGVLGLEAWRSDGTVGGTWRLVDAAAGTAGSIPTDFAVNGSTAAFGAGASGNVTLYRTDGTQVGTTLVRAGFSFLAEPIPAFGGFGFVARTGSNPVQLWRSDGTNAGTLALPTTPTTTSAQNPAPFGNRVLFQASMSSSGAELFTSDGTTNGTLLLRDLFQNGGDTDVQEMLPFGNQLFFRAPTAALGNEPWLSDGTQAGTNAILDINPQSSSSTPTDPALWNGEVWFGGNWPNAGIELIRSNGTAAGTQLGIDVHQGGAHSGPRNLTAVGNRLYFTATIASGNELFVTDGAGNGTLQFDLQAGSNSSFPERLTALGQRLVFAATDAAHGLEPWVSDGTVAGTRLLADLQPNGTSGLFDGFCVFGGHAWFSANVPGAGIELCRTDGTPGGTGLFADLAPGTAGARPNGFVATSNRLFFRAYVDGLETGLWSTDGTVAGTRAVLDLPGTLSAEILDMVAVGSSLYFVADDRVHGRELWTSDGSAGGTRLVADLDIGFAHGVLAGTLASLGTTGLVAFAGSDGQDGLQLWVSNGTTAGTFVLGRLGFGAGSGAAALHSLQMVGNRLFCVADDGVLGEELWMFDLATGNAAFAQNYGASQCQGTGGRLPHIAANGLPRLGNAGFGIDLSNARPAAFATLGLGFAPSAQVLDGCRILLAAPFQSLPLRTTDGSGFTRTPFPVPASPAYQGLQLFSQYAVFDPAGALLDGFALSEGLWLRLGT